MTYRLSAKQKWQLVLSLVIIYYPVLLYLDFPVYSPNREMTLPILSYQLVVGLIIFLFYFLWVQASEWVLNQLFGRFGESFMLEFRLPAQLACVVLATALAISFVAATREVLEGLDLILKKVFQVRLTIPRPQPFTPEFLNLYKRANIGFFLMLMLSGFYLIANRRANLRMKDIDLKAERLEKERAQAQLAALKTQVNPHFLFNSLSMLSSLLHVDADLSEQFIDQLARAYRYILEQQEKELVLLKTELAFMESYVFLLKIRFENKFELVLDLPEQDGNGYYIAPLTLQLLVENAVKHNRMSQESPLQVSICREGGELIVKNNRQLRPQTRRLTGLGLRNIEARYRLLTDRNMSVEESEEEFTVRIPLLTVSRFVY